MAAMRMSLGEIFGLVTTRMADPDGVGERMVIQEINNAGEEIAILIREQWNEKSLEVEHVSVVSGQNLYNLPAPCGDIVKLECQVVPAGRFVPLNRVQLGADDADPGVSGVLPPSFYSESMGYVLLPNRQLRLVSTPAVSVDSGLRFTYYPRYVPLVKLTDEPRLPDAIHECLVPRALDRLRQHKGVDLTNPKEFESYRTRMERTLISYLLPADSERAPRVDDEFGAYQEIF